MLPRQFTTTWRWSYPHRRQPSPAIWSSGSYPGSASTQTVPHRFDLRIWLGRHAFSELSTRSRSRSHAAQRASAWATFAIRTASLPPGGPNGPGGPGGPAPMAHVVSAGCGPNAYPGPNGNQPMYNNGASRPGFGPGLAAFLAGLLAHCSLGMALDLLPATSPLAVAHKDQTVRSRVEDHLVLTATLAHRSLTHLDLRSDSLSSADPWHVRRRTLRRPPGSGPGPNNQQRPGPPQKRQSFFRRSMAMLTGGNSHNNGPPPPKAASKCECSSSPTPIGAARPRSADDYEKPDHPRKSQFLGAGGERSRVGYPRRRRQVLASLLCRSEDRWHAKARGRQQSLDGEHG